MEMEGQSIDTVISEVDCSLLENCCGEMQKELEKERVVKRRKGYLVISASFVLCSLLNGILGGYFEAEGVRGFNQTLNLSQLEYSSILGVMAGMSSSGFFSMYKKNSSSIKNLSYLLGGAGLGLVLNYVGYGIGQIASHVQRN